MRWKLTYLGTSIAKAVASADAYAIVDQYQLQTWSAGGCAVLATAIASITGGDVFWIVSAGRRQHAVAHWDGAYFDSDGAYTAQGIIEKFNDLEDFSDSRLVQDDGRNRHGIPRPEGAVRAIAELLRDVVFY